MVSVALIDFGNTLADETWLRHDCDRFPSWTAHYAAVVAELRDRWDTGQLRTAELAEQVAARLGGDATPGDVHAYLASLCRTLRFYPAITAAVRARRAQGERQALVTVNPDLFTEVVRHYRLNDLFDVIVTSWEHGCDDKTELCHRALALLGGRSATDSVLIDNLPGNVDAWRKAGGHGYLFRDDSTFAADLDAGRVPAFSRPPAGCQT